MTNRLSPQTRAAQALHRIDPTSGAVVPGIEMATTYARDDSYSPRAPYIYAREGGATVGHAEEVLADLEGAADSLLFASGMAAVGCLFEALPPKAHVLAPRIQYHGVATWLRRLAERGRLTLTTYDQADPAALAEIPAGTDLVWVETPANPSWDVVDIAAAARAAHAAGARLAVDGTCAPPCTTLALGLGADIAFHSATKYLGGHSDLTSGLLSVADPAFGAELRGLRTLMGNLLAPFEAWLLIRGIRTLFVRFARASDSALAIATHFEGDERLKSVLYPGLPTHPGHAVAAAQMTGGFGGMLSIETLGDAATAQAVARGCRLWLPATSLGGVESLIEHRKAVEGPHSVVPETLIRLSTGLEAPEDLIADLERALAAG